MAGIPGGLPAGSLSLTPNFVLWAAICFILLFIAGTIAWLVLHDPLLRLLRRLWLSDLIVAWLLYAALYHLVILKAFRTVEGAPYAVWGLWAALGLYVLLRRLRTPFAQDRRSTPRSASSLR